MLFRSVQTKRGKQAVRVSWAEDHMGGGKYGSIHTYGNGGAHYNRAIYDRRGQFKEWSEHRCITAKMRRLCKDIIIDKK